MVSQMVLYLWRHNYIHACMHSPGEQHINRLSCDDYFIIMRTIITYTVESTITTNIIESDKFDKFYSIALYSDTVWDLLR